jgi:hypothetical protein
MVTPKRTKITNEEILSDYFNNNNNILDFPVINKSGDVNVVDGRIKSPGDFDTCTQEIFDILAEPFLNQEWLKWLESIWQKEKDSKLENITDVIGKDEHFCNELFFIIEGNRCYSARYNPDSTEVALAIHITPDIINHIWSGFIVHEISHTNTYSLGQRIESCQQVWDYVEDKWKNVSSMIDIPFEVWREISHTREFNDKFMRNAKEIKNLGLIDENEYEAIVEYYSLIGPGKNTEILPQHLVMKNKFSG